MDYSLGVGTDNCDNAYVSGNFSGTVDFDPCTGSDKHESNGDYDIFLLKVRPDGCWQAAGKFRLLDYGECEIAVKLMSYSAIISLPRLLMKFGEAFMRKVRFQDIENDWPATCYSAEIARFRKGEQEALIGVFKSFEPDLNRYYRYCFGKPDLVEEALQEFYKLMVTRLLDRKYRSVNVALYRIWRKDAARRIHKFIRHNAVADLEDIDCTVVPTDAGDDIDPISRARLMECIEELKSRDRQIISLHFFDGMPMTEIPKEMTDMGKEISYSNVRQIVVRALRLLKECLERKGDDND